MTLIDFELGKTRIMAEARDALRRVGIDYHCVMFDAHSVRTALEGATLTVSAEGSSADGWFTTDEIEDCKERVSRADIRRKIANLAALIKETAAA